MRGVPMHPSLPDEERHKLSSPQSETPINLVTNNGREASINWWETLKQVTPIYISTHIAFLALTYLATLFTLGNYSSNALRMRTLLNSWFHWDTGQFTYIATNGYDKLYRMAFFPLFPLLERMLAVIVRDPFVAGLIISNLAALAMFMVLYRLVVE